MSKTKKIKISKLDKLKTEYTYALMLRDKVYRGADDEFNKTMDPSEKEMEKIRCVLRDKHEKVMEPYWKKYTIIEDKAQAVRKKAVAAVNKAFQKARKELEDYEGELNVRK